MAQLSFHKITATPTGTTHAHKVIVQQVTAGSKYDLWVGENGGAPRKILDHNYQKLVKGVSFIAPADGDRAYIYRADSSGASLVRVSWIVRGGAGGARISIVRETSPGTSAVSLHTETSISANSDGTNTTISTPDISIGDILYAEVVLADDATEVFVQVEIIYS